MDFLVIDDDKTFRDATCYLIDEAGHYAEGVDSGRLGLGTLKEDKFDAVLLDVNLGAENGLDILPEIIRQNPQMPVVMFTAQGSVKVAVEAMRRGAVDFLEKPFQREQFMTVLARLQRLNQMSRRIERLEQEVTEIKTQGLEPIFDFSTPAMQEVMDVLEQVDRDKSASEDEIETLRDSLRSLHRDQGHRPQRNYPPPSSRPAPVSPEPVPEAEMPSADEE